MINKEVCYSSLVGDHSESQILVIEKYFLKTLSSQKYSR